MRNQAQVRGQIIAKRMNLLNNYLIKEADSGKSLPSFMAEKGITPSMFFQELPEEFKKIEDGDRESVQAYADALNDLYYRQYLIFKGEGNGSYSAEGVCGPRKCLHPSGTCVRCVGGVLPSADGNSCDGHSVDGLPAGAGVVVEGDQYYASGCGLPPIRPIVRDIPKNKDKWDKFRAKKATYEKCRDAKKEDKKANKPEDGKKGLHAINKFNPAFVTARASFMSLVALNFRNLAFNMNRIKAKPHLLKKLKAKWYNMGGDWTKLLKVIDKAKDKKPLFGKGKGADGSLSADAGHYYPTGVEETGLAGWIALGSGVLAAVAPIIKALKKENNEPLGDEVPPETSGPTPDVPDDTDDDDGAPDGESFWNTKTIMITVGVVLLISGVAYAVVLGKKG